METYLMGEDVNKHHFKLASEDEGDLIDIVPVRTIAEVSKSTPLCETVFTIYELNDGRWGVQSKEYDISSRKLEILEGDVFDPHDDREVVIFFGISDLTKKLFKEAGVDYRPYEKDATWHDE